MTKPLSASFTLKAELHCHSHVHKRVSYFPVIYDSVQPVERIIEECLAKDIRILAITDHNTLDGYRKAVQIIDRRHLPILLIPACEISSADGHILAYGITREIPEDLPCRKVIDLIHSQGGLAVAAHPFISFGLGQKVFGVQLDALEGFNSLIFSLQNRKSIPASRKIGIPHIAGSDAHIPKDIGRSVNLFPADTTSLSRFLAHLKNGEFIPRPASSSLIFSTLEGILSSFKYSLFHK